LISVILTTIGRDTLSRTLRSLGQQDWMPGDEVLLVHDGAASDDTKALWLKSRVPGRLIAIMDGPHEDWGHTPRNRVMNEVAGSHVLHLDDDDCYAPGTIAAVRKVMAKHGKSILMFQMKCPDSRGTIWTKPELVYGNVGTPMICHPAKCKLGRWASRYGGDFDFIRQTVAQNPDLSVVWVPRVITLVGHDHA
jgi:Glycosyl transferase family 2